MKNKTIYRTDLIGARRVIYLLAGYLGVVMYIAGLVFIIINRPDFLKNVSLPVMIGVGALPAAFMILGVVEMIVLAIKKLNRAISGTQLYLSVGALTLGGILGALFSLITVIQAGLDGTARGCGTIIVMMAGGCFCYIFDGLLFKNYHRS